MSINGTIDLVRCKLVDKILGKLHMLNNAASLFWVGWAHCPDYGNSSIFFWENLLYWLEERTILSRVNLLF